MRTAALRYCLSGLIFTALPVLTHASLEYSVKTESADLFRTQAMEPPPVITLSHGDILKMIKMGDAVSLIESEGGVKGWIRNEDVVAMKSAGATQHNLAEQSVRVGEFNHSMDNWYRPVDEVEVSPPNRNFSDYIIQTLDKEQVEMKNGDN